MPTTKKDLIEKKAKGWVSVNLLLDPNEVKQLEALKTFLGIKNNAGVFRSLLATKFQEVKGERG